MKETSKDIDFAINVLTQHNKWRKGANIPVTNPKELGKAIDIAIKELKKLKPCR
jgi:hypothetical protein